MNTEALPLPLSKFIASWFASACVEPGPGTHRHIDIPSAFSAAQAAAVLDLESMALQDGAAAERRLREWTPSVFSRAQARCVHELLSLDPRELRATLVDAMEPCELRDRLVIA
ncbi:hypothetical protein QTH90_14645 [Variovorax sp. J2P1-59]|uniref:hypothetical protein n=1 Tax=Variovorax flavidus TaxID=3053501 RepID=UPI0025749C83|nr:hypothetical protein [Variovorax sp. J2P1-59]MDM0075639.1 hypothetical protein [Variovorax sp. J2P1-59]